MNVSTGAQVGEEFTAEQQADLWLQRDARRLGLDYSAYCDLFGLYGPSQERRVRRHEVSVDPITAQRMAGQRG